MNNDQHRIDAVERFRNLNADINNDLNSILDLVAHICDAPVALITLIGDDIQWFKISKDIVIKNVDRNLSFCNYTIQQNEVMVVPDARADKRFCNHPMVCGDPYVCFYAGSALVTKDGYAIGSLCVIDFEPRLLNESQKETLKILSKQVMNLMELNWSIDVLKQQRDQSQHQKLVIEQSELKLKAMFNSSKDTHILVGRQLEVLAFNKAAAAFVRDAHRKKLTKGVSIMEYSDPDVIEGLTKMFDQAFGGKTIEMEWLMRPGTKFARWKELQLLPIRNSDKEIIGVALNSTDITERKHQEEQINIQNAALTRIAIIQSHELRRPVASLLGILSLIKLEQLNKDFDYFDMIEITINELDEKIREIVKDSETTINTHHLAIVA